MSRPRSGGGVPSRWWKNPYCHYCGKEVVKWRPGYKKCRADLGTVEHIPPLWMARMMGVKAARVLACYSCNTAENKRVQAMFPAYFFHLWNGGDLPKGRKMLKKGTS